MDYADRMREEARELSERLIKAKGYLAFASGSSQLAPIDRLLLETQVHLMQGYLEILTARIERAIATRPDGA